MYSNIQKQCLQTLGITAYELKTSEPSSAALKDQAADDANQAKSRPSLSALLKAQPKEQPKEQPLFDWQDSPKAFLDDLMLVNKNAEIVGNKIQFENGSAWNVDLVAKSAYVENNDLVSPEPAKLSVTDKKLVWAWLCKQVKLGED